MNSEIIKLAKEHGVDWKTDINGFVWLRNHVGSWTPIHTTPAFGWTRVKSKTDTLLLLGYRL